jgi:predicted CoA-binding protein
MSGAEHRSVAVLGASNHRQKYGNRAVRAYKAAGWDVYPVNLHEERIEGLRVYRSILDVPRVVDRVTLYLQPDVALEVLDEIARSGAREVFFNPGSESPEAMARAEELGLLPIQACSIIEIGRSPAHPEF